MPTDRPPSITNKFQSNFVLEFQLRREHDQSILNLLTWIAFWADAEGLFVEIQEKQELLHEKLAVADFLLANEIFDLFML